MRGGLGAELGHWVWAVGVCAGLFGWGAGLARLPGLPRDAGSAGCLGVAFAVVCGGVCDFFRIVGPGVAIGFVAIGILLGAALFLPAIRRPAVPAGVAARALLAAVLLVGALAVVGHVYYPDFSRYDDYSAYLVFPEKMLATGSLGFEPFSERRLLASLGGLYFLHTLVLAGADFFYLHVIDPAFGLLLTLLLLEAGMRRHAVGLAWRLAVLLFALLLLPSIVNLTAILLPVALMVFAYVVVEAEPELEAGPRGVGRVVALALVGAALVAIKPAYLPWIGGFLAMVYGRRIVLERFRRGAWREPIALAVLTVVLLPWMFANSRDVGTALYPLLGSGFHASRYGIYPPVWSSAPPGTMAASLLFQGRTLGPEVIAAGLMIALGGGRAVSFAFLAAGLVLVAVITVGTAGQDMLRYSYPGVCSILLVGAYRMAIGGRGAVARAVAVAAALVVVAGNAHGLAQYYGHAAGNLAVAAMGPGIRPGMLAAVLRRDGGAEGRAVQHMQDAAPAGAVLLERLDYPFLLDFRRNDVLVADWPGAASLPPGMPMFQGPEKLAAYLLGVSVRYVAYAYGDEAKFPASDRDTLPADGWIGMEAKLAWDFQANLAALMRTRKVIFHDDTRAVIDLAERVD